MRWKATRGRLPVPGEVVCAELHVDGALDELPCLACGYPTLTERGGHHSCVVCHWQDDDSMGDQPGQSQRSKPRSHAAAGSRLDII